MATTAPALTSAQQAQQLANQNAAIRQAILANGISRLQQIYGLGIVPANQNGPVNIPVQNVGLIRGFLVELQGTLHNSGGGAAALTALGASNVLSSITFNDFNNINRVQTTGWHMSLLNSAKNNMVFGACYAPNVPMGYGNNWTVMDAPSAPAAGADAPVSWFYYVPLAYAKNDLRGAVYAGLTGATAQLQLTVNPNPFAAAGDATLSVYSGEAGAWKAGTNLNITVYQDYIDQLPRDQNNNVLLPPIDLSTIYELKNTSNTAFTVNQEFNNLFTNYRTFLSTALIFDNGGDLNTGDDVNYFALQAANSTNIWKYTPQVAALLARGIFMGDPPPGVYWFDSRAAPINTQVFGNMGLIVNPLVVNAGATFLLGYEDFAMTQTIGSAASLPSS